MLGSLWLALKTGNQKNKINKIETSFFKNIIKIGYSVVRLSRKKKREDTNYYYQKYYLLQG